MIYTLTLNPSIDYIVRLEHLAIGQVNRILTDNKYAGGKGINVSRVLHRLGYSTKALGFIGGFTGQFIKDSLHQEGLSTDFISVAGDSRINIKLKERKETEINGTGPVISGAELDQLKAKLESLTSSDTLVLAGSVPANQDKQVYQQLLAIAKARGAEVVCDFEGQALLDCLAYQPLLIKPNQYELADLFGVTIDSLSAVEKYASRLLDKGAKHVLVSMAGEGALLVTKSGHYFARPIKGQVKNSVGAGDSMVAGFTGHLTQTGEALEALKWGVAAGTATAFSDDLASADFIQTLYQEVEVEQR